MNEPSAEPDLMELSTVELVRRLPDGDSDVREALFARYRERVLIIARARLSPGLRTKVDSGDILQEALLKMDVALDADPRWNCYAGYFKLTYAERLGKSTGDRQKFL